MVIGISDPDGVMLQIANSLKDSLAPDIMPFVNIRAIEMEGKQVIEIDVVTGTNRPYYIREKGLKPSGVYVRKGSSYEEMCIRDSFQIMRKNYVRKTDTFSRMVFTVMLFSLANSMYEVTFQSFQYDLLIFTLIDVYKRQVWKRSLL